MFEKHSAQVTLRLAFLIALGGCTLAPEEAADEHARALEQGAPYEAAFEQRPLPELPDRPQWQDVLHRALLAHGDLEAAYFEWRAAVERIGIAAAYPNTNVMLGFSYAVSDAGMKTFDRSTFTVGFDSMENLSFPTKVRQRGKLALELARAAGERFRAVKFDLQKRVLVAWAEYTLLAEKLRIEREQRELGRILLESARGRVRAGGDQQGLLAADVADGIAGDAVRNTEALLEVARAALNSLLARAPDAPLPPPSPFPPPRALPVDDATLLASAVERNPELAALAREVEGRKDALELARLQWIPDVNPSAVITGSVVEALGAAIVLPTAIREIEGRIREAEAMVRASDAMLRQSERDRAASFVATLVALRNAERQATLFATQIIPRADEVASIVRQSYAAGSSAYRDVIAAERTRLDAQLTLAEARSARETRLAELEDLMGVDVETFASHAREQTAAIPIAHSEAADGVRTGDAR